MGERSIFITALDKACPKERAAYVEEACGLDRALRQRVEQLLEIHRDGDGFLETPAVAEVFPDAFRVDRPAAVHGSPHPDVGTAAAGGPPPDDAGTRIGAYKLLQKIGEGGMGVVYMADQERPVRRRVALKIIKPGMDSAQVIARFEAERQALAMMDHPNIARVFDAGTTDGGRPYFVMELVQGVPVTKYCDENQLPLRDRLALFVDVCHAIQHAHQKGVIHRDVKPTNVMVTLCDGRPAPKVIDFGIAKAVEQRLTERTLFTHYGMMVGTLEYMSPEQAEMSGVGVDTRGDVYSLGVLLYELLTGSTPLQRERLREAAFAEVLRRIREEEPPRPSTRLGTSGEMLATISTQRRTEPQKLTRLVRGELDWIVMRCLEKDRTRRYETVNGLARDVERYLADESVSAGPPGARYRLGKYVRRNKALIATTALVAAALLLGTALATWGLVAARRDRAAAVTASASEALQRQAAVDAMRRAEDARGRADEQAAAARKEAAKARAVSGFLRRALSQARPGFPSGQNVTVREALDTVVGQLNSGSLSDSADVEAALRQTIGDTYVSLGLVAAGEVQLRRALDLQRSVLRANHPDIATTLVALGMAAGERNDYGAAAGYFGEALDIRRKAYGQNHVLVQQALRRLANAVGRAEMDGADALHAESAELARKVVGKRRDAVADTLYDRAILHSYRKDHAAAEALLREALAMYRKLSDEHSVAVTTYGIGLQRYCQNDHGGAEPLFRDALERYHKVFGPDHPIKLRPLKYLYYILARRGDPEAPRVRLEWTRVDLARVHEELKALPDDPKLTNERAQLRSRLGSFAEATADRERAVALRPDDFHAHFCAAVGRLYAGDVDAYRAHARAMTERCASSNQGAALERAATAWLLSPPPDGNVAAATRLVDQDLAGERGKGWHGWAELTKAMAEYRAGHFPACLEWLEKFRAVAPQIVHGDRRYLRGTGLALAAMAHHRLGRPEEARRNLDEASRLMEQCPKPGGADLGTTPERWQVWEIFMREARGLLDASAASG